jgi:hypothetical protein
MRNRNDIVDKVDSPPKIMSKQVQPPTQYKEPSGGEMEVEETFEHKLSKALGILNEEFGKNDMDYPDPTEAKGSAKKPKKKKSAEGAHRFDPGADFDQMGDGEEFDNEDPRLDFKKKEPAKTSRPTNIKPRKKLPEMK